MLVNATKMLQKARDGHYAVGQFNINNLCLLYTSPMKQPAPTSAASKPRPVLRLRTASVATGSAMETSTVKMHPAMDAAEKTGAADTDVYKRQMQCCTA